MRIEILFYFLASWEIERINGTRDEIHLSYSFQLDKTSFTSSSRRYFLISSLYIPMKSAIGTKVWINYGKSASTWTPDQIIIMKQKEGLSLESTGEISEYFTEVNRFKFNGTTLSLHSKEQTLAAFSDTCTEIDRDLSTGMNRIKPDQSGNSEQFFRKLIMNLIDHNLWLSVFIKPGWSTFNRSARLLAALLTVTLITCGNTFLSCTRHRDCDPGIPIIFGPVQFSLNQLYLSLIQSLVVIVPVFILAVAMNYTIPWALADHYNSYARLSRIIRPLLYIFVSLSCSVLLGVNLFQARVSLYIAFSQKCVP